MDVGWKSIESEGGTIYSYATLHSFRVKFGELATTASWSWTNWCWIVGRAGKGRADPLKFSYQGCFLWIAIEMMTVQSSLGDNIGTGCVKRRQGLNASSEQHFEG